MSKKNDSVFLIEELLSLASNHIGPRTIIFPLINKIAISSTTKWGIKNLNFINISHPLGPKKLTNSSNHAM